jgi:hypothetical protein
MTPPTTASAVIRRRPTSTRPNPLAANMLNVDFHPFARFRSPCPTDIAFGHALQ